MRTIDIRTTAVIERPVAVQVLAPFQSELTPKDGRAVDELYERAKEQESVEHWLADAQAQVLHERRQRRDARLWAGQEI